MASNNSNLYTVGGLVINTKTGRAMPLNKNSNGNKGGGGKNKGGGGKNKGGGGGGKNKGGNNQNNSYVEALLEALNETKDMSKEAKAAKKAFDDAINKKIESYNNSKALAGNEILSQGEQGRQLMKQQQLNSYLRAQQGMSNRGLLGSGLQSGANAQLALAGAQQMSQLANNVNQQKANSDQTYQTVVDNLNSEKLGTTQDTIKTQLENAYREQMQKNYQLGMQAAPYFQLTQGQISDAQQQAANRASSSYNARVAADAAIYRADQLFAGDNIKFRGGQLQNNVDTYLDLAKSEIAFNGSMSPNTKAKLEEAYRYLQDFQQTDTTNR